MNSPKETFKNATAILSLVWSVGQYRWYDKKAGEKIIRQLNHMMGLRELEVKVNFD